MTREFIREEEDGTTTRTYAMEVNGIFKTHNNKGPAIVNKKQNIKDYYLYGVKLVKDDWDKKRKFS
tara:strand:+ start:2186 stop:2383 length:198 start_codon:yes stop_codon:yes gene_type:complete